MERGNGMGVIFEMFLSLDKNTTCAALGTFLCRTKRFKRQIFVVGFEDLLE